MIGAVTEELAPMGFPGGVLRGRKGPRTLGVTGIDLGSANLTWFPVLESDETLVGGDSDLGTPDPDILTI